MMGSGAAQKLEVMNDGSVSLWQYHSVIVDSVTRATARIANRAISTATQQVEGQNRVTEPRKPPAFCSLLAALAADLVRGGMVTVLLYVCRCFARLAIPLKCNVWSGLLCGKRILLGLDQVYVSSHQNTKNEKARLSTRRSPHVDMDMLPSIMIPIDDTTRLCCLLHRCIPAQASFVGTSELSRER